jgi:diguanylate cyclase (GGDEF)-like protein
MKKIHKASYQGSLAITTRAGAIAGAFFQAFFAIFYAVGDYPSIFININLLSLSLDLIALLLTQKQGSHKPSAHLVTFGLYLSLFGSALFGGGISSSSLVWLTFVPVAGMIMAGRDAGVYWGMISIGSALGLYVLNVSIGIDISLIPVSNTDRMVDIIAATLATTAAIWLSETSKSRILKELEDTGAQLDRLATVDSLTETYNRRYFMERARHEIFQSPHAALLLFDIDHFKRINDEYGHDIGDQVLQGLCKVCKDNLREKDLFARFGGEEFIILLPDTNIGKAQQIAERLCRIISITPLITSQGEMTTTISIGVSSFSSLNQVSIEMLLVQADKAMYRSKQAGRNRVTVWKTQE